MALEEVDEEEEEGDSGTFHRHIVIERRSFLRRRTRGERERKYTKETERGEKRSGKCITPRKCSSPL